MSRIDPSSVDDGPGGEELILDEVSPTPEAQEGEASHGYPILDKAPEVDPEASGVIGPDQAMRLRAVPYAVDGGRLCVAMLDPTDFAAADELSIVSGRPVTRYGIAQSVLRDLVRQVYGTTAAEMAARLGGGASTETQDDIANLEAIDADDLHRMAEQPTLINLVNLVILEAIRGRASDVHIEPFDGRLTVKYRIDGVLVEQNSPPKRLQPAITSRIKIMAGMNIAERYVPQDGHITLRFENRKVDIRVSTVPTIYGESIVMRILDKESVSLDLKHLGMSLSHRDAMERLIALPHGMVLVTGPTGSGKTTTLYAALTRLYDPAKKIITIEDPVEYELSGVNQIPVNPKRGLSFATGLRSILRQDPDVIMVGEIRDHETADISIRSALTGHLLFSTLHTNDAPSAIGRMLDMGIEPFLLASVLEAVLAQRLSRRICGDCRERHALTEAVQHRLSERERLLFPEKSGWVGAGCETCEGRGYRGRIGLYEVLMVTAAMRTAISGRKSIPEILRTAESGYVTMRGDGLQKAAAGLTTVDLVLHATQDVEGVD